MTLSLPIGSLLLPKSELHTIHFPYPAFCNAKVNVIKLENKSQQLILYKVIQTKQKDSLSSCCLSLSSSGTSLPYFQMPASKYLHTALGPCGCWSLLHCLFLLHFPQWSLRSPLLSYFFNLKRENSLPCATGMWNRKGRRVGIIHTKRIFKNYIQFLQPMAPGSTKLRTNSEISFQALLNCAIFVDSAAAGA